MRTYSIRTRSISLYDLSPHKNHSKTHYHQALVFNIKTGNKVAKLAIGHAWVTLGWLLPHALIFQSKHPAS